MPWYVRLASTVITGTAKHVNPTTHVNSGGPTVGLMLFLSSALKMLIRKNMDLLPVKQYTLTWAKFSLSNELLA